MSKIIATFFYVGHLPAAPGTWASLIAVPIGALIAAFLGPFALVIATGIAFGLGWWATERETLGKEDHDPGEIVIDEIVGQWIALLPLSMGIVVAIGDLMLDIAFNLMVAFCLFRVFDIMKPFPVSYFDNKSTPLGVMMDDVVAGIMAALGICLIVWAAG